MGLGGAPISQGKQRLHHHHCRHCHRRAVPIFQWRKLMPGEVNACSQGQLRLKLESDWSAEALTHPCSNAP